ncbi:MAG: hypothetical protein WCG47_16660 [Dermatophilaceae bacterium]
MAAIVWYAVQYRAGWSTPRERVLKGKLTRTLRHFETHGRLRGARPRVAFSPDRTDR